MLSLENKNADNEKTSKDSANNEKSVFKNKEPLDHSNRKKLGIIRHSIDMNPHSYREQ